MRIRSAGGPIGHDVRVQRRSSGPEAKSKTTATPPTPPSATEDAVLHAAAESIRAHGIRRTTIETVARNAAVSRGTIYRYWPTKGALITATFSRAAGEFIGESLAVIERESTLIDRLIANARLVRTYVPERVLLGLDETEPRTVAVLLTTDLPQLMAPWIDLWVPYIQAAQAEGEVRASLDPRRAAEWMLRILVSVVTTPGVTVDLDDPHDLGDFLRDHLIAGLG